MSSASTEKKRLVLFEALISGKGIDYIIEKAATVFNNPVTLSDSSYKLLAYSKNVVHDPVWYDLISYGYNSYDIVRRFNEEKVIEKILQRDQPILVDTGIGKEIRRILGKILIDGKLVAYIGIFESSTPFSPEDLDLADLLCNVLANALEKDKKIASLTGRLHENLLIDLLEGPPMDRLTLQGRLKAAMWNPKVFFQAICIPIDIQERAVFPLGHLRSYLERLSPLYRTVLWGDNLLLLINGDTFEELGEAWKSISQILKDHQLEGGVSFVFSPLKDLGTFYRQACEACRRGKMLGSMKNLHFYDQHFVNRLLEQWESQVNLMDYCHPGILKLYCHDQDHKSEYCQTLETYMDNACHLSRSAQRLFIHKNTMLHRMERIREISQITFQEEVDQFRLLLSLKIVAYLEEKNTLEAY